MGFTFIQSLTLLSNCDQSTSFSDYYFFMTKDLRKTCPGWCSTRNQLLICSLLCTTQCMVDVPLAMAFYISELCILKTWGTFKIFFRTKRKGIQWPFMEKTLQRQLEFACSSMLGKSSKHILPYVGHDGDVHQWYFLREKHHQKTNPNGWCMQIPQF